MLYPTWFARSLGKLFEQRSVITNSGCLHMIGLFAFAVSVLVFAATSQAQERPPIFQQIFKAYGFDSFGQVEKIRYTFNVEGLLSRSWEWEPKTDRISYEGKDKDGAPVKVTYPRSQLSSQPD